MNYNKTSKNNGIKSNKDLPAKRKEKEKNILLFKFTTAIVLTNLMTYMFFYEPVQVSIPIIAGPIPIEIPEDYLEVSIPIELMIPIPKGSKKISIIDTSNKVICREAYFISLEDGDPSVFGEQIINKYQILIHKDDLKKVMAQKGSKLWAFPFNSMVNIKQRKNYEIIF